MLSFRLILTGYFTGWRSGGKRRITLIMCGHYFRIKSSGRYIRRVVPLRTLRLHANCKLLYFYKCVCFCICIFLTPKQIALVKLQRDALLRAACHSLRCLKVISFELKLTNTRYCRSLQQNSLWQPRLMRTPIFVEYANLPMLSP